VKLYLLNLITYSYTITIAISKLNLVLLPSTTTSKSWMIFIMIIDLIMSTTNCESYSVS